MFSITCYLPLLWLVSHEASFSFAGINIFLDGFVPTENLRFRDTSLVFKVAETADKVCFVKSCLGLWMHLCTDYDLKTTTDYDLKFRPPVVIW